jgi:hypothetical protein
MNSKCVKAPVRNETFNDNLSCSLRSFFQYDYYILSSLTTVILNLIVLVDSSCKTQVRHLIRANGVLHVKVNFLFF